MDIIVSGNTVKCDGEKFGEIDLYYPSEEWMGMQLDYTRYDIGKGDDPDYGRRFGVGGIEFESVTPDAFDVVHRAMDAYSTYTDLFSWHSDYDETDYDSDGDVEMSAEFAWTLCHHIEEIYDHD